eukprot:scaffold1960_cov242-Pinguiococcus_pyrenoidosus.AAC.4
MRSDVVRDFPNGRLQRGADSVSLIQARGRGRPEAHRVGHFRGEARRSVHIPQPGVAGLSHVDASREQRNHRALQPLQRLRGRIALYNHFNKADSGLAFVQRLSPIS